MKQNIAAIILLCVALAFTACAQDQASTAPATTRSRTTEYHRFYKGLELKAHESLTDAEDAQYAKAYYKAVKTPDVMAAEKALNDAEEAAMLKVDPTVGPVLTKLDAARRIMREGDARASLTPAKLAQYNQAFSAAWKTPEVQAAVKARNDAKDAAILRIDPTVGPVADKLVAGWKAAREEAAKEAAANMEKLMDRKDDQKPMVASTAPATRAASTTRADDAHAKEEYYKALELKAHQVFTPTEDKQYRTESNQAWGTPEVKAAIRAYRDALDAAMLKADPTIGPVLVKLDTALETMKERQAMDSLTPAELAQYKPAFFIAYKTPEVKAAVQAQKDAVRAAMTKADPTVGPLIDRLDASYKALREAEQKKAEQEPAVAQ